MKAQARLRSNGDSGRWAWIVKHDDDALYLGTIYITMKDAAVLNVSDVAHLERHDHLLEIDYVDEETSSNVYTPEQLQGAREYAAALPQRLAIECFDDDFGFAAHITQADKKAYAQSNLDEANAILSGERDHNLTIAQRMHYFLTGESVPLLEINNAV